MKMNLELMDFVGISWGFREDFVGMLQSHIELYQPGAFVPVEIVALPISVAKEYADMYDEAA